MKQSTSKLKPTTLMASDLTLKGLFAMNAPDVPDWFIATDINGRQEVEYDIIGSPIFPEGFFEWDRLNNESKWIQWREYYSELMIKHF